MSSLGNLALTSTNSAMTSLLGGLYDTLQSKIANGGRDTNCKFYYSDGGASFLQVAARKLVGGAVNELKDEAMNQFKSLLSGKKKVYNQKGNDNQIEAEQKERELYGKMSVNDGSDSVLALDQWGAVSVDALMLGMPLAKGNEIEIKQIYPSYHWIKNVEKNGSITYQEENPTTNFNQITKSDTLVWYDTTAIITVNSDKNLKISPVQGRDYSRKELINNGDIKFSVSGHIVSPLPDVYPTDEVRKFLQIMRYKGAIKINNQILDQFDIDRILITDFSLNPREGYKAVQDYSFNAIGLQPEKQTKIDSDTVQILAQALQEAADESDNPWKSLFMNQLEGLKGMAVDAVGQGAALVTGLVV